MNLTKYKEILMDYLKDGKVRSPSDFDRDVTGVRVNPFMLYSNPSDTPFGHALSELMEEGKIEAWYHKEKGWEYKITSTTPKDSDL